MTQATDQSSFSLTPISKDKFGFPAAGITIIFSPEEKTFILQQGGGEYKFIKE